MRFVCSYSGGKDSVLALYRAILAGHEPAALLTTCDVENRRSWFHNIPYALLQDAADALRIPLLRVETRGDQYAADFERALQSCRAEGADMCVFGDIDIQEHFDWCDARCANVGMQSFFPLWGEPRAAPISAFMEAGFSAIITVVNASRMDARYVGQALSPALLERLSGEGVDVSGEQGEYHTFVYDGPLFARKVAFSVGEPQYQGHYVRVPIDR